MAFLTWLLVLASLVVAYCSSKLKLTAENVAHFDRIGAPVVSPCGSHFVHIHGLYNKHNDTFVPFLELVEVSTQDTPVKSAKTIQLFKENRHLQIKEVMWANCDTLLFTSNVVFEDEHTYSKSLISDTLQLCKAKSIFSGKVVFEQLTNYPLSMSNVQYNSKSNSVAFTMDVYVDDTLPADESIIEYTAKRDKLLSEQKTTGKTFDKLYIRHWDQYLDEKYSHLFLLHLDDKLLPVLELMRNTRLKTPVAPFGDKSQYAFSPDGSEIAFTAHAVEDNEAWSTNINIYTIPTKAKSKIKAHSMFSKAAHTMPAYSSDNTYLAWLGMKVEQYESDRNYVYVLNRKTGGFKVYGLGWSISPSSLLFVPGRNQILATAEEHGRVKIFLLDLDTDSYKAIINNHTNGHLQWIADGQEDLHFLYSQNSLSSPHEVWVTQLDDNKKSYLQYKNEADRLKVMQLSDLEEFEYQSGNDAVHALFLRPAGYDPKKKYPLAFLIHGGPESAWTDSWSTRWNPQMWTAEGFAVVMINPHGSTGYGDDFKRAVLNNWGGLPFEDLMVGLKETVKRYKDIIDPERMAAAGASYGGYMINWIMGKEHPFKCLVTHDGVFDLKTVYYTTDELYFSEHEFGGLPWERNTTYDKWSPSNHVAKWKTPTLVIHSGHDYRLDLSQGLSVFTTLQRKGIKSRFLTFPEESHWVQKPANWLKWNEEVMAWMKGCTA